MGSERPGVYRCPGCGDRLVKPADEGGMIVRARYFRIVPVEGGHDAVLMKCTGCDQELELREGRPLVFRARLGLLPEPSSS